MPKRKRSSNQERPPPPPPPPKSLIKLLQSDKNVLKYFTLLQANLEVDKLKWKDRANAYEKECEELKKKLAEQTKSTKAAAKKQLKKIPARTTKQPQKQSPGSENGEGVRKENGEGATKNGEGATKGEAIDDAMLDNIFDDLSSDDEESSVDLGFIKDTKKTRKPALGLESSDDEESSVDLGFKKDTEEPRKPALGLESSDDEESSVDLGFNEVTESRRKPVATAETPDDIQHAFQDVYYERLCEAHDNLERLGVALVDESGSRRSDEDVAEDLLQALRVVTRVQLMSRNKDFTAPFIDMIPACDCKNHPAYEAKQCAFTSLRIMDIFCGDMDNAKWEKLTKNREDDKTKMIQIGLRNRQSLVKDLMRSLSGEISDAWPVADRASRVLSTALHFDASETEVLPEDKDVENRAEFGAKSQARLSTILERCVLVQLLTHYHDHRDQSIDRVLLLYRYVLSTAPSLMAEDHPKYPPVLNMCVVEALLTQRSELQTNTNSVFTEIKTEQQETLQAAALAVHVAMHIWKERLQSNDDRVTDIARVQVASYERVLKLELSWFGKPLSSLEEIETRCKEFGDYGGVVSASILAIVHATVAERLREATKNVSASVFLNMSLAHSVATRTLQIRQLDWYRDHVGTPTELDAFQEQVQFLCRVKEASVDNPESFWKYVSTMAKCCIHLSDGDRAAELAQSVITFSVPSHPNNFSHEALRSLMQLSQVPLIRFINLQRRVDRRNAFQSQAKVEKLLIVDALVSFEAEDGHPSYYWGGRAFDGRSDTIDESDITDKVATHWRPSDLKAFDKDAPSDDDLVKMSSTERACALSHISSWEGVRRSLELPLSPEVSTSSFNNPNHVLRQFRVSGFATGKALLAENEDMPPVPVCVILEDDAMIVDRFVDRLEELLRELPRDFHFCSLGYSRPKTAPVVPYSSQVGIPTCIWYLTGYVLSLEGAKHLKQKLPVRGPVDSWIGLRMCANWENEYGQALGVGQSRPATDLPSRKELGQIMKFRAFCALTPLCSQRIGASTAVIRRSWRQRDTDIVYSGA
jgi:hypothetical protein